MILRFRSNWMEHSQRLLKIKPATELIPNAETQSPLTLLDVLHNKGIKLLNSNNVLGAK